MQPREPIRKAINAPARMRNRINFKFDFLAFVGARLAVLVLLTLSFPIEAIAKESGDSTPPGDTIARPTSAHPSAQYDTFEGRQTPERNDGASRIKDRINDFFDVVDLFVLRLALLALLVLGACALLQTHRTRDTKSSSDKTGV